MYGNFVKQGIKATGQTASVPDDDVAKLMYYFNCVASVINYSGLDKLTNYKNYKSLTVDDMDLLFKFVLIFNPKIFVEAGIFLLADDLLPYGKDNEFYQITDERIGLYVDDQIALGGRTVKVLKVMACNKDWLIRNYYTPWLNIFEKANQYHGSDLRKSYRPPQPPTGPLEFNGPIRKQKIKEPENPPQPLPRHKSYNCCILF